MQRLIICDRHATATTFETGPLKAAPPESLVCPLCIASRNDGERDGTETPPSHIIGRTAVDDTAMSPRVAAKLDEVQRRMMDEGRLPPLNEAEIIEGMNEASRDAEAFDHTPQHLRGSKESRRIRETSFGGVGARWPG